MTQKSQIHPISSRQEKNPHQKKTKQIKLLKVSFLQQHFLRSIFHQKSVIPKISSVPRISINKSKKKCCKRKFFLNLFEFTCLSIKKKTSHKNEKEEKKEKGRRKSFNNL